ncbi:hypothetical protein BaRGS_00010759 [Batillaria attramentaria]|uniref:CUB domain-containing protein n=1 Tax=Batillaria attramentaria TaxID=370345 RepID=A0ABD0LEP4_9CAEN
MLCASCTALRTLSDGFSLFDIDGGRHFTYAVVPEVHLEQVKLEFYDVHLPTNNCDDIKVDVYTNGYVRSPMDHTRTLCDTDALNDFTASSVQGFSVLVVSSGNVTKGQVNARFTAKGASRSTFPPRPSFAGWMPTGELIRSVKPYLRSTVEVAAEPNDVFRPPSDLVRINLCGRHFDLSRSACYRIPRIKLILERRTSSLPDSSDWNVDSKADKRHRRSKRAGRTSLRDALTHILPRENVRRKYSARLHASTNASLARRDYSRGKMAMNTYRSTIELDAENRTVNHTDDGKSEVETPVRTEANRKSASQPTATEQGTNSQASDDALGDLSPGWAHSTNETSRDRASRKEIPMWKRLLREPAVQPFISESEDRSFSQSSTESTLAKFKGHLRKLTMITMACFQSATSPGTTKSSVDPSLNTTETNTDPNLNSTRIIIDPYPNTTQVDMDRPASYNTHAEIIQSETAKMPALKWSYDNSQRKSSSTLKDVVSPFSRKMSPPAKKRSTDSQSGVRSSFTQRRPSSSKHERVSSSSAADTILLRRHAGTWDAMQESSSLRKTSPPTSWRLTPTVSPVTTQSWRPNLEKVIPAEGTSSKPGPSGCRDLNHSDTDIHTCYMPGVCRCGECDVARQ